ncbi:hydroxymethylcytosylglucuronate/cytosylglucuronate synthase [Streptomyces sp. NPDC002888]|uniref:hydroxymethylcytosylglucuronate/cytosylglucurona te synthase n=1 Tax=Streptomyces sp. NPDC002888 TaxID=3364668 RepID=UPI0036BD023F
MSDQQARAGSRPLRILASGVNFGWGSAGKLSSVLRALSSRADLEVTGIGTELGRPVLAGLGITRWRTVDASDAATVDALVSELAPDLALVILDPELATALQGAGCPVVYVDSLPFLWTEHDPLPVDVELYCAQRTLPLPPAAKTAMGRVRNLTWVPPIVPDSAGLARAALRAESGAVGRDAGLAVLNLGGLHSPFTGSTDDSYQRLVLKPALDAVSRVGVERVVITGNLPPDTELPSPGAMTVEARRCAHDDFVDLLLRAGWIVTSPGLTTLLEIAAVDRNAVLLPPQNLSQVLNADLVEHACSARLRTSWPDRVLTRASIDAWHRQGEEYAVERMRARIAAARAGHLRHVVTRELTTGIDKGLDLLANGAPSFARIAQDFGGAERVAAEILSRVPATAAA